MGGGYKAFKQKADGLAPYRYSVVIENVRERNYFTEKLIDALLCGTVPIYWGCPNIGDFFDTTGMMICESEADIQAALDKYDEKSMNGEEDSEYGDDGEMTEDGTDSAMIAGLRVA